MSATDDDTPAFPTSCDLRHMEKEGMTLRDYFAAKAMEALIHRDRFHVGMGEDHWSKQAAQSAYIAADAMLRARK